MNFKLPKRLFILLLVIVISFAGCSNKLFTQFAGKNIGVCVVYDTALNKPFEYQNSPISASEITLSLVRYLKTFHKEAAVHAITADVIKDNDIQDGTFQQQLFSDLALDNLLLLKITDHQEDYISTSLISNQIGIVSFSIRYSQVSKCAVTIHYQLLGKDESTPLFSGTSQGQSEITDHNGQTPDWVIHYEEMLAMISNAVVGALKKAKL